MQKRFNSFKSFIERIRFRPSFLSVFFNPIFFVRTGLYKNIKSSAHFMQGRMLDFGCGNKPYRDLFRVTDYIGMDLQKSGHDHSGESIDVYYDGKKIPFANEYFDSVFASEVFEHIFNIEEILPEICRVMKKEGRLLLTVPFVWEEHEIPFDFARYSCYGIKHLLEKSGFEVIKSAKTTKYFETIVQLFSIYLVQNVFPPNKFIKAGLTAILIAPITIIGIILSKILPDDQSFYHNNVIVAKKK